jgi:hypothetical protein
MRSNTSNRSSVRMRSSFAVREEFTTVRIRKTARDNTGPTYRDLRPKYSVLDDVTQIRNPFSSIDGSNGFYPACVIFAGSCSSWTTLKGYRNPRVVTGQCFNCSKTVSQGRERTYMLGDWGAESGGEHPSRAKTWAEKKGITYGGR